MQNIQIRGILITFSMTLALLDQLLLFRFYFFSLPWLFLSYLVLIKDHQILWRGPLFWGIVIFGFLSARTLGMSINRLVDQEIDRKNPRTAGRPLPSGKLSQAKVFLVILISSFIAFASLFYMGEKVFTISIFPFFLILTYSWTKRWTPFCHFWLGAIYLFVPVGISVAFFDEPFFESWVLGGAFALFIIAGDLLYSIQDVDFDRKIGLKSFPVSFGVSTTIWVTRFLILIATSLLFYLGLTGGALALGLLWGFFLGRQKIREPAFANRTFQTCNLAGGTLLLLTVWLQ